MTTPNPAMSLDLFAGPGELRELCRRIDWSATPLGPVEAWPATLRTVARAALDSPFPIQLWCGPELTLIYNDAYRPILGDKHPASLGAPGRQVWAEIWPEIEPMFATIRAGGPPIYADDAPFVVHRESTGAPRSNEPNAWFTFSLSPVRDEEGVMVAFLNVVSESTGRILAERALIRAREQAERAEQRLRDVFTGAPAFMAVVRGDDHVIEYVNDAYYQLVGRRELVGRRVIDALPEVREQGFLELLDSVLETGDPYIGREVPIMLARATGGPSEERYVDFVYYPITEADGTRSGIVAHGSDVTEHVLARKEAQRARAEAERANQAKSQFLAMMSHEIRTPINAVIGYSDLLDSGIAGELTPQQREYLDRVRSSSQHLLGLVNDVLDLAKIEAEEMEVAQARNALGPAVVAAVEMVASNARMKGVELRQSCDCPAGLCYEGDEVRVRQILLNLLSNALKFTEAGGTIEVTCGAAERVDSEPAASADGRWVFVAVRDTGSGIAEQELERIFQPFVQADAGPTRKAAGTGLGLTISRRLARMMGGEITVRSQLGAGSTFSLWLRRAETEGAGR